MKICIFGAGAIGGYIGALLCRAGVDVTLIARGPHLAAMRENGLRLYRGGECIDVRPRCTDDPAAAGVQDYVVLTMKAHGVAGVVDAMQPLLGPETAIVGAQNGLPWWYFYAHGGPLDGARLHSLDPGGALWDRLGPERMIGSVVWPAAELTAPGVIRHGNGDRIPIGEPDGSRSERVVALSKVLIEAGIKAPVRPNIRNELWMKLWGNLSFNPISVLTQATLQTMAEDDGVHRILAAMMTEAEAIGKQLGIRFPMTVEQRIATGGEVGHHKSSMLQDLLHGRPMEIEPLIGSVLEVAALVKRPCPTIQIVHDLLVLRAKQAAQ